MSHPEPKAGPFFQARIFVRARVGNDLFRAWSRDVAGVRVYSEGFRVLPYGSPENDWLEINRDYASRSRAIRVIQANQQMVEEVDLDDDVDSGLDPASLRHLFGRDLPNQGAQRRTGGACQPRGIRPEPSLRQPEGSDPAGNRPADPREGGRSTGEARSGRVACHDAKATSSSEAEEPTSAESWREEVDERITKAQAEARKLRASAASAGRPKRFEQDLERLEGELEQLATAVNALIAEQRLTPVLASVGIQMGEFVHEINGLLAMASTTDTMLDRLREDPDQFTSPKARRAIAEAHQGVRDLRARLGRQARRSHRPNQPNGSQTSLTAADRRAVGPGSRVDRPRARTAQHHSGEQGSKRSNAAMFSAEITAVLRILMNAVKAAGTNGKILAATRGKGSILRLENTGQRSTSPIQIVGSDRSRRPPPKLTRF